MKAKKRFGQNFLVDERIIDRICNAIDAKPGQHVIEIGPGRGAITQRLVESSCELSLVEIDRNLAAELNRQYPDTPLINQDVLKLDFATLQNNNEKLRIVGNLPYNISTPLMFKLFDIADLIKDMYFMLQLEVVDRITAAPNTKAFGRLTVMAQVYCQVEKLFEVPPESFSPKPAVQSAIIRLQPNPDRPAVDMATLESILITAFNARRKTIRNGLKPFLSSDDLESIGLDPGLRPENLSVQDYVRCANFVSSRP